jgi:transposase-like protein
MEKNDLRKVIAKVKKLSFTDLRELKGEIKILDQKKEVANLIESNSDIKCGHCHSKNFQKYGVRNDLQRYKCKDCKKTFNNLTGTPLARLRKKGRWLNYATCMSKGLTLQISAEISGVHLTTSFRWRHTFLENMNFIRPKQLNGIVEAVESYFYYSEKGTHNPSSNSKEMVGKNAPKVYVLTTRDRNNNTYQDIINDFDYKNVKSHHLNVFNNDILFCSQKKEFYSKITKRLKISYGRVGAKSKIIHINNVTSYKEGLHDWMSRFCGVATKYLSNYLAWYRELDEYQMKIPPELVLLRAKSVDEFPYQPLTQKIHKTNLWKI